MTYIEYANTPKGNELNQLFRNYQQDAMKSPGSWWLTNCVTYAVMMELWDFLADDDEFYIPDEAASVDARELFDRFLRWAHNATDVAIVLTIDHGDERFDAIKAAFSPVWKRVKEKQVVRQVSLDIIVDDDKKDKVLSAISEALKGTADIVGGPDFADASWTADEYGR
jgi:hypothetical protein